MQLCRKKSAALCDILLQSYNDKSLELTAANSRTKNYINPIRDISGTEKHNQAIERAQDPGVLNIFPGNCISAGFKEFNKSPVSSKTFHPVSDSARY